MTLLRQSFRKWWQVPRKSTEQIEHRTVSFLELFYDLVYVVLIAELAHALAKHPDWAGVQTFAFLFVIVWWAWFNGTLYHDLHGNNDIRTRVFTFLQMFAVAAMAVFAHNATGEGAAGFALAYAGFQVILAYLWWRTGVHDLAHRPLSRPYTTAFLIAAALFVLSVLIPAPWRFYLWGIAVISTVLLPIYTFSQGRNNPDVQAQIDQVSRISESGVERFGLFNIIVLGEVIVGVVQGLAEHHHLTWLVGITAALGMLVGIGLWWVYFDYVSHRVPRVGTLTTLGWIYLHLPLTIAISATGAVILNVVEHTGEALPTDVRWLLVGSVSIALASIAILMNTIQLPDLHQRLIRVASLITFAAALLTVGLGFSTLDTIPLLIALIVFLLAPIFYGVVVWVKVFDAQDMAAN